MKKIILIISLLLFILIPTTFKVFANTPDDVVENTGAIKIEDQSVSVVTDTETKVTNRYFDLTLSQGVQSVFNKRVTYTLKITPHLNSPKTQIIWNYPNTLKLFQHHKEFLNMKEGTTYTVKSSFKPLRQGAYNITASVISWQHDTNYTNAISDDIEFDKSLISQPVPSEYTIGTVLMYVGILIITGLGVFLVIKLVKIYSVKAKKWLTPPS